MQRNIRQSRNSALLWAKVSFSLSILCDPRLPCGTIYYSPDILLFGRDTQFFVSQFCVYVVPDTRKCLYLSIFCLCVYQHVPPNPTLLSLHCELYLGYISILFFITFIFTLSLSFIPNIALSILFQVVINLFVSFWVRDHIWAPYVTDGIMQLLKIWLL